MGLFQSKHGFSSKGEPGVKRCADFSIQGAPAYMSAGSQDWDTSYKYEN